jgi:N-acetylmuramoyl-L-alanine amidase
VAELVKDLVNRYQISPTNVLAHSDIAPTRKQDPGPLFPWKKLYDEYGIGMWYDDAKQAFLTQIIPEDFTSKFNDAAFVMKVQIELKKFGYTSLSESGVWDKATQSTIEALQYHFRPENFDGKLDMETWAILQALNQKYSTK